MIKEVLTGFLIVWAVVVIGAVLMRKRARALPTVIDGYTVHIRTSVGEGQPVLTYIEVDLGAEDFSVEPQFVVQRKLVSPPHRYDLLRWTIQQRGTFRDTAMIHDAAKEMVAYARRVAKASGELREELLQRALDGARELRLKSLLELIKQYPRSKETRRAAIAAVLDDDPAIRMHAAIFLDDEGLETVESLVADESVATALRLQGLQHCSRAVDRSRYDALLDRLLESESIEVREQAVYAFADCADEGAIDRLSAMLKTAPPPIAEAIARALGRIGSPRAEPALLELVDSNDQNLLIAAARALSRVGTTAAIARLQQAAEGAHVDEQTRAILIAAVDILRDDRRPSAGGQLSMVGAQGSLSFQEHATALSFPDED